MRPLKFSVSLSIRAAAIACCFSFVAAANAATAPAKPAAVAPPIVQDDPAKVSIAREFIILYHPKTNPKSIAAGIDLRMPRMIAAAKHDNPKLDVKAFEAETRAKIMTGSGHILDHQARVVARHFTLQELKDLLAFVSSPVGRKLAAETPKIQREMLTENRVAKAAAKGQAAKPVPPGNTPKPNPHK